MLLTLHKGSGALQSGRFKPAAAGVRQDPREGSWTFKADYYLKGWLVFLFAESENPSI